jgi:endonuclease/exonuclease/phosphatase family metal-dependent hydrolase
MVLTDISSPEFTPSTARLRLVTINMHKGVSALHLRPTVLRLRQRIREQHADLVFIQEIQQKVRGRVARLTRSAEVGVTEFLAEGFWPDWHYGRNAVYTRGHHGNAILSRHPLRRGLNYDISEYRFEKRGLLHGLVTLPGPDASPSSVHCFCAHLALFERARRRQTRAIIKVIDALTDGGPAIVAGDFNDWRNSASDVMSEAGFTEVFEALRGMPARTFPSVRPMLRMDRIYVRGLRIRSVEVLTEWAAISDHLPLAAEVELVQGNPGSR